MSCDRLTSALMATIARHAEDCHADDPASASPTISAAEAMAALSETQALLLLRLPDGATRHALRQFGDKVYEAALRSAASGESERVDFVQPGSVH